VSERFAVVVPMSWKRHVRAHVSRNEPEGVSQVGKCWEMIVWPVEMFSTYSSVTGEKEGDENVP
jgi:hypothetical protein